MPPVARHRNATYEKSCGVIVLRKPPHVKVLDAYEFLLLKYPERHWDFPKGHTEEGEDEKTTALRELLEETGIKEGRFVEGFRDALIYEFYGHYLKNKGWIHKTVVFFLYEVPYDSVLTISEEHQDFTWLPLEKDRNKITYDNARGIFDKAIYHLKKK